MQARHIAHGAGMPRGLNDDDDDDDKAKCTYNVDHNLCT